MECDEFSAEKVLTGSDAGRDSDGLLPECGNLFGQSELDNGINEMAYQVFCGPLPSCEIINVSCLENLHRLVWGYSGESPRNREAFRANFLARR